MKRLFGYTAIAVVLLFTGGIFSVNAQVLDAPPPPPTVMQPPIVTPAQSQGGTFTLTDIPSRFNGYYVFLEAVNRNHNVELIGAQTYSLVTGFATLPRIVNGRVSIPMWIVIVDGQTETLMRYTGNHTITVEIYIFRSATFNDDSIDEYIAVIYFDSVRFSNGSATKSFHDGFYYIF